MKEAYAPRIHTTVREDQLAIWVPLPDGKDYNIWDLTEKEFSANVKSAIAMAFDRGVEAGKQLCAPIPYAGFMSNARIMEAKT